MNSAPGYSGYSSKNDIYFHKIASCVFKGKKNVYN